jgi:hypothetical protein
MPGAQAVGTGDIRACGPEFWTTFSACQHRLRWCYTSVAAAIAGAGADRAEIPQAMPGCGCPESRDRSPV